ncbi:MAG: leucine-rich repeat domain-containing protein, partial [Lachnospiraceae bacterium]|nr:leucine-rich repeat domain-containing protein [Lachnospiraceae bacterium]
MRKKVKWLSVLLSAVLFFSSVNTVLAFPAESPETQQIIQEEETMQQTEDDSTEETEEDSAEQTEEDKNDEAPSDTQDDVSDNEVSEETEEELADDSFAEETIVNEIKTLSDDIVDSEEFLLIDGTTVTGLNDEGKNQENLQLVIPKTITAISSQAFMDCTNITSVVLPESLVNLNEKVFAGCSSLKKVEIQSNKIVCGPNRNNAAYGIFNGCAIEEIAFGDNVTAIPEGLFCGAGFKAGTTVEIPDRITSIGKYGFRHSSVGDVTFSKDSKLDSIGESAFENTTVTIGILPNHVREIGYQAFMDCTNITSVVLPAS